MKGRTVALSLAVILSSLLLSFFFAEYFVRFFFPQDVSGSWRVQDTHGMWVNKTSGVAKHKFGKNIVEYRFGAHHNRITSVEDAFKSLTLEPILVIGDSFTFGWLLSDADTFIAKLAKKYPNYNFINAAAGGFGAADYLRFVESYCKKISPKKIFIFFTGTEYSRTLESSLYSLNQGALVRGRNDINRMKQYANLLPYYSELLENSHLLSLARRVFLTELRRTNRLDLVPSLDRTELTKNTVVDQEAELVHLVLSELYVELRKCSQNVYFFHLGVNDLKSEPYPMGSALNRLNLLYKEKINFFDIGAQKFMKMYRASKEKYTIPYDGHPNAAGSELIYSALVEIIEEHGILNEN